MDKKNNEEPLYEVMIVDDDVNDLKLIDGFLSEVHYNVRCINSGKLALESISTKAPDLILLDVKMPEMDGFEVCRILKADQATEHIPIIFITALDDVERKVEAFNIGAVDYITKPFEEQEVIARVSNHLKLIEYTKYLQRLNTEKDRLMFQQSKMAEMGEMIGNIAHQWRQPLSVITMLVGNIKADSELEVSDSIQEHLKELKDIVNTTQALSETIDDFRSFFSPNKAKELFSLESVYEKNMTILRTTFKNREIELIKDFQDVEIFGFQNEMSHALLNILNNAKDELEKLEGKRVLFITISKSKDNVILKVRDNAGGVPLDIIDHIFEPYVTTKSNKKGTGIGLFMTKQIVEDHMHGKLRVENVEFEYKGSKYKGAEFTIELPINKM